MSFTVFLGNLPAWVTADDIKSWLTADNLVADQIKVIRNPETQESKGFAFIEAPNQEEMQSIIRRFDRAPLEDRLLRANPAQPPKSRRGPGQEGAPAARAEHPPERTGEPRMERGMERSIERGPATGPERRRSGGGGKRPDERKPRKNQGPPSAFAEELAKAL